MTIQVLFSQMSGPEVDEAVEELDKRSLEVFTHYGEHHQLIKLAEEAAELSMAAAKAANDPTPGNLMGVIEEFCDATNVMDQLVYGCTGVNVLLQGGVDPLRLRLDKLGRELARIEKLKQQKIEEIKDEEGNVIGHSMSMADLISRKDGGHS